MGDEDVSETVGNTIVSFTRRSKVESILPFVLDFTQVCDDNVGEHTGLSLSPIEPRVDPTQIHDVDFDTNRMAVG